MKIEDILSKEEIKEYHEEWENFRSKYKLNSSYNVHSGMPVISEVYQFEDKPVFRAHVFQKKLIRFNPYFISNEYHNPIWHSMHYFIAVEQLYHASSNLIRDNSKLVGKDPDIKLKIRIPIFWRVHVGGISVELILEELRKTKDYFAERTNFSFYKGNESKKLAEVTVLAFLQDRVYIKEIDSIKKGCKESIERLIRKINWQDMWQKRQLKSRANLPNKDYLITQLKQGKIPEAELHDFFSFWDKPQSG